MPSLQCTTPQALDQFFFLCPNHQENPSPLLPKGFNTLSCNRSHCFIMFGWIRSHILLNFFFFAKCVFSKWDHKHKSPNTPTFLMVHSSHSEWVWACFCSEYLSGFSLSLFFYRNWGHSSWLEVLISPGRFWMRVYGLLCLCCGRGQRAGVVERSTLINWQRWDRHNQHPLIS